MKAFKLSCKTGKAEPYEIPNEWYCRTYFENYTEIINCPHCGREFKYNDGYSSLEIYCSFSGYFYIVCPDCHEEELKRNKKYFSKKETNKRMIKRAIHKIIKVAFLGILPIIFILCSIISLLIEQSKEQEVKRQQCIDRGGKIIEIEGRWNSTGCIYGGNNE